jgi:hypothetical protein
MASADSIFVGSLFKRTEFIQIGESRASPTNLDPKATFSPFFDDR